MRRAGYGLIGSVVLLLTQPRAKNRRVELVKN
jgi:hypothetical protein